MRLPITSSSLSCLCLKEFIRWRTTLSSFRIFSTINFFIPKFLHHRCECFIISFVSMTTSISSNIQMCPCLIESTCNRRTLLIIWTESRLTFRSPQSKLFICCKFLSKFQSSLLHDIVFIDRTKGRYIVDDSVHLCIPSSLKIYIILKEKYTFLFLKNTIWSCIFIFIMLTIVNYFFLSHFFHCLLHFLKTPLDYCSSFKFYLSFWIVFLVLIHFCFFPFTFDKLPFPFKILLMFDLIT